MEAPVVAWKLLQHGSCHAAESCRWSEAMDTGLGYSTGLEFKSKSTKDRCHLPRTSSSATLGSRSSNNRRRKTAALGQHVKLRPTPGDAGCVHPDNTAEGMVGRRAPASRENSRDGYRLNLQRLHFAHRPGAHAAGRKRSQCLSIPASAKPKPAKPKPAVPR